MKHRLSPRFVVIFLAASVTTVALSGVAIADAEPVAATPGVEIAAAPGDEAPAVDGLTPATAAASCWEIKQNDPDAPSGDYWLLTPELKSPQRFYCEQGWDGGGWVLVGKGREGWQEFYLGQGNPDVLADRPTSLSPSYFGTVQLPSATVDGLLNNTPVRDLTDGVRVLRARNAAGTQWQNVQFRHQKRDRWVWTHTAAHPLTSYRFDGGSWFSGGTAANFGRDSAFQRVTHSYNSAQSWTSGFAYGNQVSGSNNAQTYLWSASGNSPRPYAEVYLRPRLLTEDLGYEGIPDGGLPASEQRAVASPYAARGFWGVTGHFNGRTAEGNAEAQDFAEHGDTMFVAGNFEYVQRGAGATGSNRVRQPALAAFDASTGDFKPGFTPTFNNQVKAVDVLPDGTLLAAGEFTVANGQPALGTVLLDPSTGDTLPGWNLQVENRLSSGVLSIRSMSREGDWVYLGGSFTHLSGGGTNNVYARHAARVNWQTGQPDPQWNPEFDGTLMDLDASDDGERLYAAGYFESSQGASANKAAAVRTVAGAPLATPAWNPVWSADNRTGYQQAIQEAGDRVYSAGSEHSIFGYDTATFERKSGSITLGIGGDFQTLATDGDVIYGGCHCSSWNFQDAYTWPSAGNNWTQADRIQWFGAWDAATGEYLPQFDPPFFRSNNAGAWGSYIASDGTVWAGGDFTGVRYSPTQSQWAGGFVRFPMNDHDAPGTPTNLALTGLTDEAATLSWNPVSDGDSLTYEVLRDDRVVATVTDTIAQVPRGGSDRYFVRAADPSGNRSATTGVLAAEDEPEPPGLVEVVAAGSDWRYAYQAQAPSDQWSSQGFDDGAWQSGAAPLGWGSSVIETVLGEGVPTAQRPLTAYFRSEFTIDDLPTAQGLTISAVADDGAVVYVNGTEVGRSRLDAGPVTHGTYANAAISTQNAIAAPLQIEVPRVLLVEGENTIAVRTHLNYRSTPNLSFDLTATLETGEPLPPEEPPEPEPEPAGPVEVVAAGSDWRYAYQAQAPSDQWSSQGFDDGAWQSGAAPLGWGSSVIETVLGEGVPTAQRPLTAYFRSEFTIDDLPTAQGLTISAVADDGAVVYVNGTEVGRSRLDAGPVTHGTYANAAISTQNAIAAPLQIEVPRGLLVEGENTIAVRTHLNYRSTPNLSFDLTATLETGP